MKLLKKNKPSENFDRHYSLVKEKKFNNLLKLMFETSIFILVGILISKIFSYLYKIIIARYLGANIFGLYSLSLVTILLFAAISGFGISEGVLRYISLYRGKNEKNKIRYIFRLSSKLLLFSTIIIALISFLLSDFISLVIFKNQALAIWLKIFSFLIPLWVFSIFFMNIMIAFERIKQQTIIEKIIQSSAKFFFLVFFIFLGLKTNAVIFSFFLGIFIFFLSTFIYCKYKLSNVFIEYHLKKSKRIQILTNLISYSVPIMFFGIISNIFYWTDSLVIGFFKTTIDVGIYNAAIPLAALLTLAPELFIQLLFPIITKEYAKKNLDLIKKLSIQIGKWIFIINLPIFFLMIFFPGTIINFFFGDEYLSGINSLRFLLIGNLFFSIFIISNKLLEMVGKSKILLTDLLIAGALNLILNIILVPKNYIFGIENLNGINGAAIATTISMILFNLLLMFHARYYTSVIPIGKEFFRIFLISLIPLSILFILRSAIQLTAFSMIVLTIFFLLTYVLSLFLFRGLDKNDLIILESMKNKFLKKVKHKNINNM